jgi:hypothetical protein
LEILNLIVPTKKSHQTFFLTKQSQVQTDCDQTKNYTFSFNQNLEKGKTLFGYQT